eukprot:7382788-Prymnesium_polylepis.1
MGWDRLGLVSVAARDHPVLYTADRRVCRTLHACFCRACRRAQRRAARPVVRSRAHDVPRREWRGCPGVSL